MNTTTCASCGLDFPDADMLPLNQGGELCSDCMENLRGAAPGLLAALQECLTSDGAACWSKREYAEKRIRYIDQIARAAIAKATGG